MAGKQLITESDVRAMARGEVLRIDSKTIVTPAALDAAHARGLRLVYGDASGCGSSSAESNGEHACLWHGMLASGGTYVVQIVNGRATVTRLTEKGPALHGTDSVEEHTG